jgi:hypothetical protein
MTAEATHEVRLYASSVRGGPKDLVFSILARVGQSNASTIATGTVLHDAHIEVIALTSAAQARPADVELGVDWDEVLDRDVWCFIAAALDTASSKYFFDARNGPAGAPPETLQRLSDRADRIAAAIRRALDDDDESGR